MSFIYIAHRGNTLGPSAWENEPQYVQEALDRGFDAEVDVWCDNAGLKLKLGHDNPQYTVSLEFLQNDHVWAHAKNWEALEFMLENGVHCFWHQADAYTLTSWGYVWTYPYKALIKRSVYVDLNTEPFFETEFAAGACCDYLASVSEEVLAKVKGK